MILEQVEETGIDFEGTIIDIESIGEFNQQFKYDSRHYKDIKQVILGYITKKKLHIYCATCPEEIEELKIKTPDIFSGLEGLFTLSIAILKVESGSIRWECKLISRESCRGRLLRGRKTPSCN